MLCESVKLSKLTGHLHWGRRVRYPPNLSSGRLLWQRCGCWNTTPHMDWSTLLFKLHLFSAPWLYLVYLFQVALAPALFCFSPLSSGELFSLFPSSLRLGELINFSRCRVLMREIRRGNRVCTKYWTGEKEGQAMSWHTQRHREETWGDSWRGRREHKQRESEREIEHAEGK